MKRIQGFTLVELLVVIAILGILTAGVGVWANGARNRAKVARAKAELQSYLKAITIARSNKGRILMTITGKTWSSYACIGQPDLSSGDAWNCRSVQEENRLALSNATNNTFNLESVALDPWGSPYIFDENEGESECGSRCGCEDWVFSAGPNKQIEEMDAGVTDAGLNADNVLIKVPFMKCPNAILCSEAPEGRCCGDEPCPL